jgi:hypothetical protein
MLSRAEWAILAVALWAIAAALLLAGHGWYAGGVAAAGTLAMTHCHEARR